GRVHWNAENLRWASATSRSSSERRGPPEPRAEPHTFIVKLVVAQQVLIAQLLHGRVIHDAEEIREDRFAHLFGKRLAFVDVFLAMALGAMSENFVEEHGGGT